MFYIAQDLFIFDYCTMDFLKFEHPNITLGDTVIIYINVKTLYVQVVEEGRVFQTKFGAVKHDQLIGKPFGFRYQCARGYVHILRPTPELWTLSLPHRTQILYFSDIALITSQLDLRPGSICIEAGTGSGSLTHSLARTLAPHGRVYTFDFHEYRVTEARAEFKSHGLGDIITSDQRDVCNNGFPEELHGKADALFLDLPHPWEAIDAAKKTLVSYGRICCFSPCVEQVQKTCTALRDSKFIEIITLECLLRPFEVKQIPTTYVDLEKKQWVDRPKRDQLLLKESDNPSQMDTESVRNAEEIKSHKKEKIYMCASPITEIAGHTGFLTFATNFI